MKKKKKQFQSMIHYCQVQRMLGLFSMDYICSTNKTNLLDSCATRAPSSGAKDIDHNEIESKRNMG